MKFTDPVDFQNFLQTSDADFLWTDCEEIQAMCNQYQMTVTVVKVIGAECDPVISEIGPDPDILKLGLPNTTLMRLGQVPAMYLLLEGAHYDLAIPEETIHEKYSGTSNDSDHGDGYMAEEEGDEAEVFKTPEERLTEVITKYNKLKLEHKQSLREIKDLKSRLKLSEPNMDDGDSDSINEENNLAQLKSKGFRKTCPQSEAEKNLKCAVCNKSFNTNNKLRNHMETHDKDGDWTCGDLECSYQTNTEANLKSHKLAAHPNKGACGAFQGGGQGTDRRVDPANVDGRTETAYEENPNSYNICEKDFVYRIDLNKHVREKHITYKPCRNIKTCVYAPRCRYNHKEYPEGHQVCYECGNVSKTLHDLMRHRKKEHKVPLCKNFLKNTCQFSEHDCYHMHTKKAQNTSVKIVTNNPNHSVSQGQGFQGVESNLAPPSISEGPTQAEWDQMKLAMNKLNEMMSRFQ